jgi:glutathione S-transferase
VVEIILHHYGISLFSERVRLALGLKGVPWRSVDIPAMMPKPDLLPLTGGYRRTPVMQIGADVYCDTLLILEELDRRHPAPSLYPGNSHGMVKALAWWADRFVVPPSLGVLAAVIGREIPADFVAERKDFGFPLDADEAASVLYRHLQQGTAHFGWLSEMLGDGRPYLLGRDVSAADLAAYCPLWLLKTRVGAKAEAMLGLAPLNGWYDRITAIGHGSPQEMSAEEALAVARETVPDEFTGHRGKDPSGLARGQEVIVRADDTGRDPVRGRLLAADGQRLVIRCEHPRVGEVNIHFPSAGFDVTPA